MASYTAVLDRLVDESAVLLLERDGEVVDEHVTAVSNLPDAGRHEGAVFEVELVDSSLDAVDYRPAAERERRDRAQERFDQLSERLSDE
ncbi:DUF3006 domain-containing protein [Natrialbaceae archaeon A-arb3/5]